MLEIIYAIVGLAIGAILAFFIVKSGKSRLEAETGFLNKSLNSKDLELKEIREQVVEFQADISGLNTEKHSLVENLERNFAELKKIKDELNAKNEIQETLKENESKLKLEIGNLTFKMEATKEKLEVQKQELERNLIDLEKSKIDLKKNSEFLENSKENESQLKLEISNLNFKLETNQEKLATQKEEIEKIQENFSESFKNLANDILDDKSSKFTKLNKENLDSILNPLQMKIVEFQKIVSETNKDSLLSNKGLVEQIIHLKEMNKQISDEANNLTKALKGDVKVQGNWGEIILERILEESGLRKGEEYETQVSFTNDEGKRYQPDVVVHLPDSKDLIVDSKVSLISYENFVNAENEEKRNKHQKLLATSVKAHIDGLHKKHYHDIKELNSPDFVLLFMPIEGSFATVMQFDTELYKFALDRHIVIVSPSTLLATMRTIAYIWRQENQTKNAIEIARLSGALYDKFEGFLSDLDKIGSHVQKTQDAYENAVKKLKTGKGNLVGRAEKLKALGAKASKSIPDKFLPVEEGKEGRSDE